MYMKKTTLLLFFLLATQAFGSVSHDMVNALQASPVYSLMVDGSCFYVSANKQDIIKKEAKSGDEIVVFSATNYEQVKGVGGFTLSPDGATILLYNIDALNNVMDSVSYYVFDRQRKRIEPLSEYGKQQVPHYSPNGRMIAFVRNNDLYIKRLDYGTEMRVTESGRTDTLSNGLADEVYQKGFGINQSVVWSPDSKMLAFVQYDQTDVPYYTQLENSGVYPAIKKQRYAKPEFPITKARLFVYVLQFRKLTAMILPDEQENYITALNWSYSPDLLGINTLNREQKHRKVIFINPLSGVPRVAFQEESDKAIAPTQATELQFLPDNSFVLLSGKSGNTHVYHYATNGMLIKQLTSGKYDVTKLYGYDEQKKLFYYQSTANGEANRGVYFVGLKGDIHALFDDEGDHNVVFSPQFSHLVHQFSSLNTPPVYTFCDAKGKQIALLQENAAVKDLVKTNAVPSKEMITLLMEEGNSVSAYLIKPQNFAADKKYPVIIVVQESANKWEVSFAQDIAEQGYLVVSVDTKRAQKVADLLSTIDAIGKLPFIDSQSVAVIGVGVHAHTAIVALANADSKMKAVVAISPITDFADYTAVLSERWMGLPQKNFADYEQASLLNKTFSSQAAFLLIHNVDNADIHIQHTWNLVDALVQSGYQFDMQVYSHSPFDEESLLLQPHCLQRILHFLNNNR